MSGSNIVNANLTKWELLTHKALESAMDRHIKTSVVYAKMNHRWIDRSGASTANIMSETESKVVEITSQIYGDIMTNLYLERAYFFNGEYAIIEQARNENLALLWAEIRGILKGTGLGLRVGGI